MSTLKVRQVDQALTSKLGFAAHDVHHHIYRLYLDGVLAARTFMSHGQRELDEYHVGQMAKQMRLSRQEFLDAVECPLDAETYRTLVRQRRDGP